MFINYVEDGCFKKLTKQHNIMVFIGNGFDISVLSKYRDDKLVTTYSKFYDFLRFKGFDEENLLYKKMSYDKIEGKEGWSDFECALGELIQEGINSERLDNDLNEIQNMFLLFLNEIVTPQILMKVSKDAEICKWGFNSLSRFLGDLKREDYLNFSFPKLTQHYDLYNFLFVNFNYTSLFDNYIYLDKSQFDPKKYKNIDTNFEFYPDPNLYNCDFFKRKEQTVWSSYILTNTIHPHGYQNIPRSLLFGVEDEEFKKLKTLDKFNKSYWAQNDKKYSKYFDETRLFIVYGTSLGKSDCWWWKRIANSLLIADSELIVYYYSKEYNTEDIKDMFIKACSVNYDEEQIKIIKNKIFVILYSSCDNHYFLGLGNRK